MAQTKGSRIFVWAMLAMIIVGLIGFGSTNLSGNIRSIGSVGDQEISVNAYARALQQEIAAAEAQIGRSISFAEAQAFGIDAQTLSQVVTVALLDAEMSRLGVSVGDENLREQLLQIQAFQGLNGQFDREAYSFALQNAGLSESEFEEQLRNEISRTLLQSAILGGTTINDTFAKAMVGFLRETRDITWSELTLGDLETIVAAPEEVALKSYYDDNIADYTLPETRRITYVWLTPDMIVDTVEVDEQALRDSYARRADEFNTPERRLVERLSFPDMTSAQNAVSRLTNGEASFEELVAERGLELIDIDLGDVTREELGQSGDAVFADDALGVVGPLQTSLGPVVYRVNAILAAQTTEFEDALPLLRDELAYDRARRVIDTLMSDVDDMLAAGATLEEVANDTEMQLGSIGYHDAVSDAIAGYADFRTAAAQVTTDDFPEVATLDDGGIFAMRLDAIEDEQPESFDTVRESVSEDLLRALQLEQLEKQAKERIDAISNGASFAELGMTANVETALTRNSQISGAPAILALNAFELANAGDLGSLNSGTGVIVYRLDAVTAPDLSSDESTSLTNVVTRQIEAELEQEIFEAFANAVRARTEIEIKDQALNAVHANFQ
jgi:peptidyl-prolyl cis-trans isomerase D